MSFKSRYTFEQRSREASRIKERFPGRIPVIVEPADRTIDAPSIDKNKFLCPKDLTVGQFVYVIRRRMEMPAEKSLFIFVNNTLPTTSTLMSDIYTRFADPDGFVYVKYSGESTFG